MEAIKCLKERRSVRRFNDKTVDKAVIEEIISAAAFSPSWKNTQTVRWNIITDEALKKRLAEECIPNGHKNASIIMSSSCVAVQSSVSGLSGYNPDGSFTTEKKDGWEMYDAGVAAQSFCLAAHDKGIGTVIMGIIDSGAIEKLLDIPQGERVIAVIPMGYPLDEAKCPPKKTTEEISRFF